MYSLLWKKNSDSWSVYVYCVFEYTVCRCVAMVWMTPSVCVCFYVWACVQDRESDSSHVSYSSTKVSFPFLFHTSPIFYFCAQLVELVVSSHNTQNPLGVFWKSEKRCAFFMMCWYSSRFVGADKNIQG